MQRQYNDTNPHFISPLDHETPHPPHGPYIHPRSRVPRYQQPQGGEYLGPGPGPGPVPESPQPFLPQHHKSTNMEDDSHMQEAPKRKLPPPPYGYGSRVPSGSRPHWGGNHPSHPNHAPYQPSSTVGPTGRRTTSVACGVCSLLIVIGLVILVLYLVLRPRNPTFDISNATLNAIYLDMGYLLSVDLTLLTNFTNPNDKGSVEFKYATVNLYHDGTTIASTNVDPFPLVSGEYRFQDVHLVANQVALSSNHSHLISKQMESGNVWFQVKGLFRMRSDGFIKYSYWLYGYCTIVLTYPPPGVLVAKRCSIKR